MKNYIGIDIGGTYIKYAKIDEALNIIEKWSHETEKFENKDEFYDYIVSNIGNLDNINSIGVCAPGIIGEDGNANSPGAPNVAIIFRTNIKEEIEKRIENINVEVINDAKAAGLCELKLGNAKGTKSSGFLIIGTGVGGCICNESDVIYGNKGGAGEFHTVPNINYETGKLQMQGNLSCITGLIRYYNNLVNEDQQIETGIEVTERFLREEPDAIKAVEVWIRNISMQLISITVFYGPEIICIGGAVSKEKWFIDLVRKTYNDLLREYLMGLRLGDTKIEACKFNNDSNIIGAILKVINKQGGERNE